MPRSPLTEQYQRVMSLVEQLHALEPDERNFILDLLVPETEPVKKSQKKSSKKVRADHCVATLPTMNKICGSGEQHLMHHEKAHHNYHEFQSGKKLAGGGGGRKSKHASSLQQQIQGTATGKPHLGEGPICGICAHTEDYEDHFKPSPHYHEFQPPATTAASGGGG